MAIFHSAFRFTKEKSGKERRKIMDKMKKEKALIHNFLPYHHDLLHPCNRSDSRVRGLHTPCSCWTPGFLSQDVGEGPLMEGRHLLYDRMAFVLHNQYPLFYNPVFLGPSGTNKHKIRIGNGTLKRCYNKGPLISAFSIPVP